MIMSDLLARFVKVSFSPTVEVYSLTMIASDSHTCSDGLGLSERPDICERSSSALEYRNTVEL